MRVISSSVPFPPQQHTPDRLSHPLSLVQHTRVSCAMYIDVDNKPAISGPPLTLAVAPRLNWYLRSYIRVFVELLVRVDDVGPALWPLPNPVLLSWFSETSSSSDGPLFDFVV